MVIFFSTTLFFVFGLFIADKLFGDGRISSSGEVFMILHTSITSGLTMLLLFLLLPFLPKFRLSVTKVMLENDRPDFDEVNRFKTSDKTQMCSAAARTFLQIVDLALIHALSHFKEFPFAGVIV